MPISACENCVYRKYLNDGTDMCTNKLAQLTLVGMDIVKMKKRDYLERCPNQSNKHDPAMVGYTEPDELVKRAAVIKNLKKPPSQPPKQQGLF